MSSARLFVKAATPIASSLLILTGVLQLRAQSWTVGGICVVLAMLGFILSIRLLEKTPFTTDELTILLPWMIPVISWAVVVGLITLSVFYVADHFESAQTDRIAAIAWAGSVILGMFIVWGNYPGQKIIGHLWNGKDFQIFNLSTPRIYSGFPTFAFIAPDNPRADLSAESIPDLQLPLNGEIGFFAIPENRALIQEMGQRYPGGESGVMYRRAKPNEVLFEYYIIKP